MVLPGEIQKVSNYPFATVGLTCYQFQVLFHLFIPAIIQQDIGIHYNYTQRIIQFVKGLKDSQAETVLIVSHGAILTASILSLLGFETAQLRHRGGLDNSSITILETQDFEHFTELAWNDSSYKLTEVETIAVS